MVVDGWMLIFIKTDNMFGALKSFLGIKPSANYAELVQNGAKIIDVRTPTEYKSGHIKNSTNIPLQSLSQKLKSLNKAQTIITCCASGMRSANAKNILKSNGFEKVYNGGGWQNLQNKI